MLIVYQQTYRRNPQLDKHTRRTLKLILYFNCFIRSGGSGSGGGINLTDAIPESTSAGRFYNLNKSNN